MTQDKTEIEMHYDYAKAGNEALELLRIEGDKSSSFCVIAHECYCKLSNYINFLKNAAAESKLQAKVQELEGWKPDEDSYLCGYQQAVLNSTGIIVSPNEGAGSFSRWLQRLSQRTSPPTENHYAEKLVNLNRQIVSLQSELLALKSENEDAYEVLEYQKKWIADLQAALEKLQSAKKQGGWVSVNDGLPEKKGMYLWFDGVVIMYTHFNPELDTDYFKRTAAMWQEITPPPKPEEGALSDKEQKE